MGVLILKARHSNMQSSNVGLTHSNGTGWAFLFRTLDDEIVNLEYRNLEKLGLNSIDRHAIFDVYCTDRKDKHFIVELQRTPQRYFKVTRRGSENSTP
jgi:hypothetical protein